MRIVVVKSIVEMIGDLWMGGMAAQQTVLTGEQKQQMKDAEGNWTRESCGEWLKANAGDFSSITDFRVEIETVTEDGEETIEIDWKTEDAKLLYSLHSCPF